jgi:hypothetical protein
MRRHLDLTALTPVGAHRHRAGSAGSRRDRVLTNWTAGRVDPDRTAAEAPLEPRSDQPLHLLAPGVLQLQVRRRVQDHPDVLFAPGLDGPIERICSCRTYGLVAPLHTGLLRAEAMFRTAFLDRSDRDIPKVRAPVGGLLLEPQDPAFFAVAIVRCGFLDFCAGPIERRPPTS